MKPPKRKILTRFDLAKHFADLGFKKGVEVGVARGVYSEILLKSIPGLELFCVDPWTVYRGGRRGGRKSVQFAAYDEAVGRLADYNAHIIRKFSTNAVKAFVNDSLDFVFIDANHNFDYVIEDIVAWSRKVKAGGIVSGHDYYKFNDSGVIEAVNSYVNFHKVELNLTLRNDDMPRDDRWPTWWWVKK